GRRRASHRLTVDPQAASRPRAATQEDCGPGRRWSAHSGQSRHLTHDAGQDVRTPRRNGVVPLIRIGAADLEHQPGTVTSALAERQAHGIARPARRRRQREGPRRFDLGDGAEHDLGSNRRAELFADGQCGRADGKVPRGLGGADQLTLEANPPAGTGRADRRPVETEQLDELLVPSLAAVLRQSRRAPVERLGKPGEALLPAGGGARGTRTVVEAVTGREGGAALLPHLSPAAGWVKGVSRHLRRRTKGRLPPPRARRRAKVRRRSGTPPGLRLRYGNPIERLSTP